MLFRSALLALGISLLLNLNTPLLFLVFSFFVLIGTMVLAKSARNVCQQDPVATILLRLSVAARQPSVSGSPTVAGAGSRFATMV
jgi:hypothetical protein